MADGQRRPEGHSSSEGGRADLHSEMLDSRALYVSHLKSVVWHVRTASWIILLFRNNWGKLNGEISRAIFCCVFICS